MTEEHWLINSNRSQVKRFTKNDKSIAEVFEYMFIDSGKITGIFGEQPPVMTTREELKIDKAREEWKKFLAQGWRQTKVVW